MTRRMACLLGLLGAASLTFAGCETARVAGPKKPGLYEGPAYDLRRYGIYGTVGLPFSVAPTAVCEGGTWNTRADVVTGRLPPGLKLNPDSSITGVPELAGDWNFSARFSGIVCANKTYADETQYVNIKISGSSAP